MKAPGRIATLRGRATERLGPGAARTLVVLIVLGLGRAATIVVLAEAVARAVVSGIGGGAGLEDAVVTAAVAALTRGLIEWIARVAAARNALGVAHDTRRQLVDHALAEGSDASGSTVLLATTRLDALEEYLTRVVPAAVAAGIVPIVVGIRVLSLDLVSAVILVLTVPLVVVFLVLIGLHTRDRVADSTAALSRMTDHLVELARGLPVLVGLGRLDDQLAALDGLSERYRTATMRTLRVAFLSALALELVSTISVAIVAVFIGVRLIAGDLTLQTALLVLLLAPECYSPFREVGAAFHASRDGIAALEDARQVLSVRRPRTRRPADPGAGPVPIRVERLGVSHAGDGPEVLRELDALAPAGRITVVTGASGAGKSTLLSAVVDALPPGARRGGDVSGADRSTAWQPQFPTFTESRVSDELNRYAAAIAQDERADAVRTAVASVGLQPLLDSDPIDLSPGEQRLLAFCRVLLRVRGGAGLVVVDEPTAHLDGDAATAVLDEIRMLRGVATVIVASHDPEVVALADHRIEVDTVTTPMAPGTTTALKTMTTALSGDRAPIVRPVLPTAIAPAPHAEEGRSGLRAGDGAVARAVLSVVPRLVVAAVLATAAAASGAALTALSGWLIVRASEQPPIMYLMVAIVGVRFFGLGRAVLRYAERLVTHDAAFRVGARTRMSLWRGLGALGPAYRRGLGGAAVVDRLVAGADAVRDLLPRATIPAAAAVGVVGAATVATALLFAQALPVIVGFGVAALASAALALVADHGAAARRQTAESAAIAVVAATLRSADELRVNGLADDAARRVADVGDAAVAAGRRGALAFGAGSALVTAASGIAAVLMVAVGAPAIAAGGLEPGVLAALALLPLGLLEPVIAGIDAVRLAPALSAADRRLRMPTPPRRTSDDGHAATAQTRPVAGPAPYLPSVELRAATARWPGAPVTTLSGIDARLEPGRPLVITGPSGSGKSTILAVLLGQLPLESGMLLVGGVDTAAWNIESFAGRVAWCPQEAHVFDASVRANLMLARRRNDAPTEHELWEALGRAGLADIVAERPGGLDSRVGASGGELSGGERQRLAVARALLSRGGILLLDEPTAHLDEPTARALIADVRAGARDRSLAIVTHHLDELLPDDRLLELPASRTAIGDGASRSAVPIRA